MARILKWLVFALEELIESKVEFYIPDRVKEDAKNSIISQKYQFTLENTFLSLFLVSNSQNTEWSDVVFITVDNFSKLHL